LDFLTFLFVALMIAVAFVLTMTVRGYILRNVERKREEQHQLQEEVRRQAAIQGNPRSATRSNR
jgi:heme exporter protein D